MLYGRPVAGELGFSLNPFHYVKKVASGFVKVDKAVLKNKWVQRAATTAANVYAPGSGALVSAGFSTVNSKPGGPPATIGPPPGSPPASGAPAAAPDGSDGSAGGDGGGGGAGGGGGGGAKILGLPKKYVMIGGAVLGGVLVLSLLTSKKG